MKLSALKYCGSLYEVSYLTRHICKKQVHFLSYIKIREERPWMLRCLHFMLGHY